MSEQWRHRVAVVTGASKGIGARIAVNLANAGIVVVGLARNADMIEELNKEVTASTGKIYARQCDLTDERSIVDSFKWVRDKFYVIHILINNAGMSKANFLTESSAKEMKEIFDVNVIATSVCMREALKHMAATKTRSHIMVINSVYGHRVMEVPVPLFSVYPATKHAITALCQTTRQEIRFLKLNIKLTSISPGMVDTDFLKIYSNAVDNYPKLQADDVAKAVMYALETPEHVQVEEIILQAYRHIDKA